MPQFRYTAKDSQGQTVGGSIEADKKESAIAILHKKSLIVISLSEEKAKKKAKKQKAKLDDLVIFSRQLATMVDSGISLVQALSILGEQTENSALGSVTLQMQKDIESGSSLSNALSKHPQVFSEFYINMVMAGEASGKLNDILERVALYLEKTNALQRKVKSSLVYPAVVISMAFIITTFLLVKVVPTFKSIFQTLGGTLPLPTQILIGISDFLRQYIFMFIIMVFILVFLLKKYIASKHGRYKFDKMSLKLPVVGSLFRKVAVAKFSRTLSTLVSSGVPILNALEIVGKTAGNMIVEEAVISAGKSIRDGEAIADPLKKSGVFPPMVTRMISVGEQSGQLEKMLNKIADFYDEQVDAAVSGMTSLIEPLVISFLGIIIGGIVVALFLPIFKITELLGR